MTLWKYTLNIRTCVYENWNFENIANILYSHNWKSYNAIILGTSRVELDTSSTPWTISAQSRMRVPSAPAQRAGPRLSARCPRPVTARLRWSRVRWGTRGLSSVTASRAVRSLKECVGIANWKNISERILRLISRFMCQADLPWLNAACQISIFFTGTRHWTDGIRTPNVLNRKTCGNISNAKNSLRWMP